MIHRRFFSLRPAVVVTHSDFENLEPFVWSLPRLFREEQGKLIYKKRNELREFTWQGHTCIVKSFHTPNLLNRLIYGVLRKSKARRSFEYAQLLRSKGFGTPTPVAYYTERFLGLLFGRSYYVSLRSQLPHTYWDIVAHRLSSDEEELYLRAIARTTALLHEAGMIHLDYSQGNILLGMGADGEPRVEIIDLNRIRFRKVSIEEGCRNYADRLPTTIPQRRIVAEEYARVRGAEAEQCFELLTQAYDAKD